MKLPALLILVALFVPGFVSAQSLPTEVRVQNFEIYDGGADDSQHFELRFANGLLDSVIEQTPTTRTYYTRLSEYGRSPLDWKSSLKFANVETYKLWDVDNNFYFYERWQYDSTSISGDTLSRFTVGDQRTSILPDVSQTKRFWNFITYRDVKSDRYLGDIYRSYFVSDTGDIDYATRHETKRDEHGKIVLQDVYNFSKQQSKWKFSNRYTYTYNGDDIAAMVTWKSVADDSIVPSKRYDMYRWWNNDQVDPFDEKPLFYRTSNWDTVSKSWTITDTATFAYDNIGRVTSRHLNGVHSVYEYFEDGTTKLQESRYRGWGGTEIVSGTKIERVLDTDGSIIREIEWWRGTDNSGVQRDTLYHITQIREYFYHKATAHAERATSNDVLRLAGNGVIEVAPSQLSPLDVKWYDVTGRLLMSSSESSHRLNIPSELPEHQPLMLTVSSGTQSIGSIRLMR